MRPSAFSDAAGSDISGRDKSDGDIRDIRYTGERPERKLVVAGFAGYEGTGILAREKRERLQRILPQWLVDRAASFAEDAAAICAAAERAGSVHALISDTWAVPGKTGDSQEAAGGREMAGQEIMELPRGICELILPVYGRPRLMLLNHCPMRTQLGLTGGREDKNGNKEGSQNR